MNIPAPDMNLVFKMLCIPRVEKLSSNRVKLFIFCLSGKIEHCMSF